jgi:hypothetical protein
MPYCPKCGIEVEYGVYECPLCSFEIPEIPHEMDVKKEEIELKNYYAELKELKKRRKKGTKRVTFLVIILLIAFAGFNNAMQDWYTNNSLTFAPYVLSSLGLITGIVICIFGFIKNWKLVFLFLFVITTVFLYSIDRYAGGIDWFFTLAVPAVSSAFGILFLTVFLIKTRSRGGFYNGGMIAAAVAVLSILAEIILDLNFGELKLTWSIQVSVTAFITAIVLVFARYLVNNNVFKYLKRYFHF